MKKFILFSLSIVFGMGLFAQTDFYYLGDGKRVDCKIKKDMVVFKCQPQTDIDALVEQDLFTFVHRYRKDLVIATIDTLKSNLEIVKNHRDISDVTYALECSGEIQMPNGNIFLRMKGGISPETLLDDAGLTPLVEKVELFNPYSQIYKVCLNVPLGDILQISRDLYELNRCEFVEPSFILLMKPPITHSHDTNSFHSNPPSKNPSNTNPYYPYQWGLHNDGTYPSSGPHPANPGTDIKAEGAWNITKGDPNIKIAVLDEGVQLDHPDLEANILKELGYDVFEDTMNTGYYGNCNPGDNHGTLCSGVICALDNDIGIVGIAPNCKIVSVRIAYKTGCKSDLPGGDCSWWTDDEWIAQAITYAYETAKVDIMSIAWQRPLAYQVVIDAFANAVKYGRNGKGCIVTVAAGNGGECDLCFPAYLDEVIAVNGIFADGESYGCCGYSLDVTAPAVAIYTTDVNSTYVLETGTSLSAPLVSGVAALMLSVNPTLTWQQVHYIIESTTQKHFWGPNVDDFTYIDDPEGHPNGL